ncbi:MAG: hypothetical protein JO285_04530 [Kutzneria sp.]|nr:hypothetical protein [Kutzneria sp.]
MTVVRDTPAPHRGPVDHTPVPETVAEADPVGLCTFDIGTVPASVTPPGTWKRAAWFSIGSSAAALIGLLAVATALVDPSRLRAQFESLPGHPFEVPLPSVTTSAPQPGTVGYPTAVAARTQAMDDDALAVNDQHRPVPSTTARSSPPGATPLPPITTAPGPALPIVDPTKIAKQTQHFFTALNTNVSEAYDLTSGALRASGEAALQQRYADLASVQVQGIVVDPSRAVTISTVLVTRKDGSTVTEQHALKFSVDDVPLITDDYKQ